jgi:type III restriction enzyme
MGQKNINKLIINSPYFEPQQYWLYNRDDRTFSTVEGRRPAGYVMATPNSKSFDDPGIFIEIELVNRIRKRVKKWREANYPGITAITKRLLEHWNDNEARDFPFFFCQMEAIETLIWLTEAPDAEKQGIDIKGDGGAFERWCNKMATGTGKTIVITMIAAWNILNKVNDSKDNRFSKNILAVAPGLTVKNRLKVIDPNEKDNYFEAFNIVPVNLMDKLRQGNVKVINWHKLQWDNEEQIEKRKTVDKRGPKSDEAYVREVLGEMANSKNIVVINDEAHHAWRINPELKVKRVSKEQKAEATVWVGGLDRIHQARGILRCFDLSATPFSPTGKKSAEEALFPWIVSDFGLNDSIESGLVKTPRVVVRDDSKVDKELKSRLYHIYSDSEVKDDINRKAEEHEPLPDLLQNAYYLLGKDWEETKKRWEEVGQKVPPVMITVANRTETSSRIKYTFDHNKIDIPELCDPDKTLQIDTKILDHAESEEEPVQVSSEGEKRSKKEQAELLRQKVDTVGKIGEPGEQIQNVISVGMLSEGWDAKTVTHIMGLRAFSSQLLCEQVVGRGLRRVSYDVDHDGLFEPEYVNIFGIPFTFLPHEGGEDTPPPPPKAKTEIKPVDEKLDHKISWPNVIRIDRVYTPQLHLNFEIIEPLEVDPYEAITEAQLAAMISGKPNPAALTEIDLQNLAEKYRLQTIIFKIASTIYNAEKKPDWKGSKEAFLAQLVTIVEKFLWSDKIKIKGGKGEGFKEKAWQRRILLMLNMNKIVQYIWDKIKSENTQKLEPVLDKEHPIRSTEDMRTWHTSKPCEWTQKSHISHCVYDSGWEASEAYHLDRSELVDSFVKNDHIGFGIYYNYKGVIKRYYPDFIIRLSNGAHLVLETKGVDSKENQTKRSYLDEWVKAVNQKGGFGDWHWNVSYHPSDLEEILEKHLKEEVEN